MLVWARYEQKFILCVERFGYRCILVWASYDSIFILVWERYHKFY